MKLQKIRNPQKFFINFAKFNGFDDPVLILVYKLFNMYNYKYFILQF